MTETKDQILERMRESMPFHLPDRIRPYIEEAMQTYADQQLILHDVVGRSEQLFCNCEEIIGYYKYSGEIRCRKCRKEIDVVK